MKSTIQLILLISLFLTSATGCKKLSKLTQFTMAYKVSIVIPSSTGIQLPFNILTPDVKSNSESTFAMKDTRKDMVEEIRLTKLGLTITSPSNGNFDFLKSIDIFITADGLPETKIAWKYDIANGVGNSIELETTVSDLKEYIKKDEFKLRVSTVTDEFITSDYAIDVNALFFVDAKILGL